MSTQQLDLATFPLLIIKEEELEDIDTSTNHCSLFYLADCYLIGLEIKAGVRKESDKYRIAGTDLNRVIEYNHSEIIFLSEDQQLLFNSIFRGRREMMKRRGLIGEAIYEVINCRDIQKEMEWWL